MFICRMKGASAKLLEPKINNLHGKYKEKKNIEKEQKKQIKTDLSSLKKAVNKTKMETITKEQAQEIKYAKDQLETSAREIMG